MKVSFKQKSKKQRCLEALPQFTDQPLETNQEEQQPLHPPHPNPQHSHVSQEARQLAMEFQAQGDKLALDGKYREALGKWESALTLMPELAVLHEQKAQVLLEIGDAWNALKAATRATELEPSWAEAWVTLGRAQLNFGEPDNAIESFDAALSLKPDFEEARDDRKTALHLVKKRKQLHSSGLSATSNRYVALWRNIPNLDPMILPETLCREPISTAVSLPENVANFQLPISIEELINSMIQDGTIAIISPTLSQSIHHSFRLALEPNLFESKCPSCVQSGINTPKLSHESRADSQAICEPHDPLALMSPPHPAQSGLELASPSVLSLIHPWEEDSK
ncbi:hypothetical protein PIB30_045724 [Stylosanthes scabra]|uniref:Uncharacterized protein n=1 Tax=Stylosanthes scabra TaxID=79078 RepID=A0ABU6XE98_9FABA|nr:hypothetical protein [Stylosanthes scabra]